MVSRPLVIIRESWDLEHLATKSSSWELEKPEPSWVRTAAVLGAPMPPRVPRCLPGCPDASRGAEGLSPLRVPLAEVRNTLRFILPLQIFMPPAPQLPLLLLRLVPNLKDWFCVFGGKTSACKGAAEFCPDHVQILPLLDNTQA